MTLKKVQLVMLPTNEKAEDCLAIYYNGKIGIAKELLTQSYLKSAGVKTFHLYFLSDEEIKEGDWYIADNTVFRADTKFRENNRNNPNGNNGSKKIIATTDSSLRYITGVSNTTINMGDGDEYIPSTKPLPQPSQSFLEVFVTEYNKGNQIKEVLVEYEHEGYKDWFGYNETELPIWVPNYELKINPKDNTITIKKVKDSFTKAELKEWAEKHKYVWGLYNGNTALPYESFMRWIEQNL